MEFKENTDFDLIGLGEVMLRLSPPNKEKISQSETFEKNAGGSELNVVSGAAMLGIRSAIVTKLPENKMGHFIRNKIRYGNVSDDYIIYDHSPQKRLGVYYYESGAYPRKSSVIYDRANSSFWSLSLDELPEDIYAKTKIFHISSITLALDPSLKETAIEMIHTYSLIHDDLPAMDNDDYRRGRLTTHKVFGEDFGILAGDGLLNLAYEIMAEALISGEGDMTAKAKAMEVIARKAGIKGMVGGQAVDVELTGKALSDEQLDFIFRLKTGALIEAAFLAGAYLAGCDEKSADRLCRAASLIGFAFQIRDDILDVTSSLQELGKPVFSDEKNNKTTYVTLYGMEKAEADVQSMSDEALDIIKSVGKNEFLEEIVLNLIHRNK